MQSKAAIAASILLIGAAGALTACDVDVDDKGKLPEVNVEPGRAPDVDVRGPDVDVQGGQMPKYDVEKTQEGKMPSVNVTPPAENDAQQ